MKNKKFKAKVGDIVSVHALDLLFYEGYGNISEEGLMPVYVFGRLILMDNEKICVAMAENAVAAHGDSNFDQRMYIPIGCVLDVNVLKQKGRKNGKANHSNK